MIRDVTQSRFYGRHTKVLNLQTQLSEFTSYAIPFLPITRHTTANEIVSSSSFSKASRKSSQDGVFRSIGLLVYDSLVKFVNYNTYYLLNIKYTTVRSLPEMGLYTYLAGRPGKKRQLRTMVLAIKVKLLNMRTQKGNMFWVRQI